MKKQSKTLNLNLSIKGKIPASSGPEEPDISFSQTAELSGSEVVAAARRKV